MLVKVDKELKLACYKYEDNEELTCNFYGCPVPLLNDMVLIHNFNRYEMCEEYEVIFSMKHLKAKYSRPWKSYKLCGMFGFFVQFIMSLFFISYNYINYNIPIGVGVISILLFQLFGCLVIFLFNYPTGVIDCNGKYIKFKTGENNLNDCRKLI